MSELVQVEPDIGKCCRKLKITKGTAWGYGAGKNQRIGTENDFGGEGGVMFGKGFLAYPECGQLRYSFVDDGGRTSRAVPWRPPLTEICCIGCGLAGPL